MSRAGKRSDRPKGDFYETPIECVLPMLEELRKVLPFRRRGGPRILDPGAGSGNISRAVLQAYGGDRIQLSAVELDWRKQPELKATLAGAARHTIAILDYLDGGDPSSPPEGLAESLGGPFDLTIGNPPFSLATEFVERSAALTRPGGIVALLLRVAIVESFDRFEWWLEHEPAAERYLTPRPSFGYSKKTGKRGTDMTAYAWFLWPGGVPLTPRTAADLRERLPGGPFGWYKWREPRASRSDAPA